MEADMRSFEGYSVSEHIVLEHEDHKATNEKTATTSFRTAAETPKYVTAG